MKNTIMIIGATMLFAACTKEKLRTPNPGTTNSKSEPTTARKAPDDLLGKISVSEYGFLIMTDSNVYADYLSFLDSNSLEDIDDLHDEIGFTSQASVEGQAGNFIEPSVHHGEYVFNSSAMVQIGSVVYRGVNSEGYYLAMPASALNDATAAQLAGKFFDPEVMCKLKVGGEYGTDLERFVTEHIGFEDDTTPPSPPEVCARKVTHIYRGGGVTVIDESWYFLGFRYKHVVTIIDGRP